MKRSSKLRSRLLVPTGSVIALGSLAACVTDLSYRYDPSADGASSGQTRPGSCREILLIGGEGANASVPIAQTFKGAIAGAQIHWTVGPDVLPYPSSGTGALLVRTRVQVAGGFDHFNQFTSLIGNTWEEPARKLPGRGAGCTMASPLPELVQMLCVANGNAPSSPSAFGGKVAENGDIPWVDATPSVKLETGSTAVVVGGQWLVVAQDGSAELGTPNPGDPRLITWSAAPPRPKPAFLGCAVGVENRAFFISGKGETAVVMATVAAGSVAWSTENLPPLPEDRVTPACIHSNGRIWVLGGASAGSGKSITDTVYSAPVSAAGLGPWERANEPLQNPVSAASVACLP